MKLFVAIIALLGFASLAKGQDWDYNGPFHDNWARDFEKCVEDPTRPGYRQSPINIQPGSLVNETMDSEFCFGAGYFGKIEGELTNNGHTIVFNFPLNAPTVSGGIFGDKKYRVKNVHCHWGDGRREEPNLEKGTGTFFGEGSEHFIDDISFMAECHFVHKVDGEADYAVLGFMFEQTADTSSNFLQSLNLGSATLRKAKSKQAFTLDMGAFFSSVDLSMYFNYKGSLTTPACSEVVEWVLFYNRVPAIAANVNKLNKIRDNGNVRIKNNWRRPQAIGPREVKLITVVRADDPTTP